MTPGFSRAGVLFAIGAYTLWGFMPAFWKLLSSVSALTIFAHRVAWSSVFFLVLARAMGHGGEFVATLRDRRRLALLGLTGALVGSNWLAFIYSVSTGQVLQASLGYFMSPLLNVLLGVIFLRERPRPLQWVAVALAALGVLRFAWAAQGIPWLAIFLASTFGFYGLARKQLPVRPIVASAVESLYLVPPALAYLVFSPETAVPASGGVWGLLAFGGVLTALPLLWFVEAAKRLPLMTLGLFQYLSPSLQFALAVFAYHEGFGAPQAIGFGLIWSGLGIYTLNLLRSRPAKPAPPPRSRAGDRASARSSAGA